MNNNRKKNSVLIVDDESTNIIALTNILSNDYNVYASSEGQDAIEVAEKYMPDIILLDVLMPEMDGYDVIASLKNSETTRSIPVIFITGLDNIMAEEKGLAMGAVDYIPKPFSSAIVKLRIQNQLKIVNHTHELGERLLQQALMTKIAHNFLTDAYIDSLFTETLCMVGEFMNISQVLLYKLEDDNSTLVCISEWIKPELRLQERVGNKMELGEQVISLINKLLVTKEGDLCFHSNDRTFHELLMPYRKNFDNYIITPIFVKGKIRAILDFSREESGQEWSESEINLAILISSIFSGAFERDAMERQFSIVEHSPNLTLYITAQATVEYVSPAVVAVTGYTKHEFMAGGLGIIFGETTLTEIKDKHIPKAMSGETVVFEIDITRKDGNKHILMVSIVRTGKNNLSIITNDLTEIRELEKGLIVAKEQAEHSSRAKSEFLARMSHEMLTPMNGIMGMMQIIQMRGIPDSAKENFDKMNTASRQLLKLINDVLDIAGMEYGISKLTDSIFDFKALVQEVSQEAGYNASIKQQSLNFNIDPAIPCSLTGDKKRLTQVIANLLANAVKFTPEKGEISFDARVLNEDNGVVTLQIEVCDNGIGITKEQQNKLFNIFEQVDGGNTRKQGGIGIGLALSKRIIEMMNGNIWVESELSKGSKFFFTCKLQKA